MKLLFLLLTFNVFAQTKTVLNADFVSNITANENAIKNASFELNSTKSWSTSGSGISLAIESTVIEQSSGAKSLKATLSSSTNGQLINQFTSNSQWSGVQATASCKIKTPLSGVKFCSISGGVEDNCLDVSSANTWQDYLIPTVASSSSTNGLKVKVGSGTLTGDIYVDGCKYASGLNQLDVGQASVYGTLRYGYNANCQQSVTSTSYSSFPTDTDCPTPTVTGNITAPSTKIPALNSNWKVGDYEIDLNTEFSGSTTSMLINCRMYLGTTASDDYMIITRGVNASYEDNKYSLKFKMSLTSDYSGEMNLQCKSNTGSVVISTGGGTDAQMLFTVKYFPPQSKIISASNQDYDWTAYTPTFTGLGTATNINCKHKREGSDLLIDCRFTTGVPTATEARISLPSSLVSKSDLPYLSIAGNLIDDLASADVRYILKEPSVSYVTVGLQNGANGALSKKNGNSAFGSAYNESFIARIPIQGWNTPNQVIATVKDNVQMSVPNGKPKTTLASMECASTSSITKQFSSDFIAISNISSGFCNATIRTGLFSSTPICTGSWNGSGNAYGNTTINASSATNVQITGYQSAGSPSAGYGVNIICVGY